MLPGYGGENPTPQWVLDLADDTTKTMGVAPFEYYRGRAHLMGQMNAAKLAVQDSRNYSPIIAIYEWSSFAQDPETGYGTGEPSPGALPAYGVWSRRLGTAPASY